MKEWADICGDYGTLFSSIRDSLLADLTGVQYAFLDDEAFLDLMMNSPSEGQKVYWTEILYRAHWASALTIARQAKWLDCCAQLLASDSLLGFSACLRGLVESSADAVHGVGGLPGALTGLREVITTALARRCTQLCISTEIEDRLIHFV